MSFNGASILFFFKFLFFFFFSSRRRHTRLTCDWSSDVCSSDLGKNNRQHLQLKNNVGSVETGHTHKEQHAGDDVNNESCDAPWYESMQRSYRQLFEESEYAEIECSGCTDQQDQAKEVKVLEYRPDPHRSIDH